MTGSGPVTLLGLFIGISISLVLLLYPSSQPNVARLGRVEDAAATWAARGEKSARSASGRSISAPRPRAERCDRLREEQ